MTLSASLPDGNYDWLIGLFDAAGDGSRVPLQGVDGGTSSIRLGTLRLANAGTTLTFIAETNTPGPDPTLWYGQHLNNSNQVVNFGDARTDGSIWLRREGSTWLLKTWPRERNFTLEFNPARFAQPAKVLCTGGTTAEVTPVQTGTHWRLPLNGATEYRWTNPPPRLSISRTNETVVVSWPASANGFTLETATDVASRIDWTSVNVPPTTTNGLTSVTLPAAEPRQFHRLRQ